MADIKLPHYVRAALSFYVTSDATGLNAVLSFKGMSALMDGDFEAGARKMCEEFNRLASVTDARPMTADEVREYMHNEREEKAA